MSFHVPQFYALIYNLCHLTLPVYSLNCVNFICMHVGILLGKPGTMYLRSTGQDPSDLPF